MAASTANERIEIALLTDLVSRNPMQREAGRTLAAKLRSALPRCPS
jgi:hypothetical protein